ncbi:ATP-dependent DNA helicase RecQ [Acaryochloris sp. CCMEE 5410]|uniref:RecQ family ATP-dependent DNA helicase n=1 Tax=Acaryochloris sp. CCMEE 5410 TaxID=310037 RepID=UPI0002484D7A|nr:RecQ family ATP-dependent DNA helicase [Acaryochloris sp. CCMEE 5410]KAI9132963.1 ATP-dependent DNA helicase RecQ [Acaryochloris sp. CCMEE 5410]
MRLDHSQAWDKAIAGLQKFWGYSEFRPLQGEAVTSLLRHQDALVMLPTGSGKSVCFQLPALLQSGLTIVISPLIALMEDQVQALQAKKLPAGMIHSQLSSQKRRQTLRQIEQQQLRLLYLSPESLLSPPIWQRLGDPHLQIRCLIVDEAHCIEQWGSSFRPVYRRLGAIRDALLPTNAASPITVAAYTATAKPSTQSTIQAVLQLHQPQVLSCSPYRQNLDLTVEVAWTPTCRRQKLLRFIGRQAHSAGLVYTSNRRLCESLAAWFCQQHQPTVAYHAGLSAPERRCIEAQWLQGELPFVICTSAFGMGIDKPDVRWIAHYHPPLSLSAYLQEIGRAGRDNLRSQTLLLASEPTGWLDPQDRQMRQYFLKQLKGQQESAQRLVHQLPRQGHIDTITKAFPGADLALALLHQSGLLVWEDPFHFRIVAAQGFIPPPIPTKLDITDYLYTRQCRWQFILQQFGFDQEAYHFRCGHCDRCCSRTSKSRSFH